jgi:type II secretory pathway pseudopilin PulG
MECKQTKRFKSGFAFLEILLVAVVIIVLCYLALKSYLKNPSMDKTTQEVLSQQGIDTSSQKAVLDSARERIKDLNKQILGQEKQVEDLK